MLTATLGRVEIGMVAGGGGGGGAGGHIDRLLYHLVSWGFAMLPPLPHSLFTKC